MRKTITAAEGEAVPARKPLTVFISVLTLFLTLILFVSAMLIYLNYDRAVDAALRTAERTYATSLTRIAQAEAALIDPIITAIEVFSDNPAPRKDVGSMETLLDTFMTTMEQVPQIFEIYAAYENSDFYAIYSISGEYPEAAMALGVPDGTRWAIQEIIADEAGDRERRWRYLSAAREEIARTSEDNPSYDPTVRDWYIQARTNGGGLAVSAPYVFATTKMVGVTYAKKFEGAAPGVLAIDVTLTRLSEFLNQVSLADDHRLIIFNGDGTVIADSAASEDRLIVADADSFRTVTLDDVSDPAVAAVIDRFQSEGRVPFSTFTVNGENFLASINSIPVAGGDLPQYLAYIAPESYFTAELVDAAVSTALLSLGIIVLSIPIVTIVSRWISQPLAQLSAESDMIRNLSLDAPVNIRSKISEVDTLAQSMDRMKGALRDVTKFVPKATVETILKSSDDTKIGGDRRELSFLFTDVADFTPISEGMRPEALLDQMSDYFQLLVAEILKSGGTVDKYIGDAIFAFWNAPLRIDNPQARACETALLCRAVSNDLNARWQEAGQKPWITRFGVHTGVAVVGNVGSSDRIDYTAIGDAVNVASRLEGLNKFYGTQILASGQVILRVGDRFVSRMLDRTQPKGTSVPLDVHELVGLRDGDSAVLASQAEIDLCDHWKAFYKVYEARDWSRALDTLEDFMNRYPADLTAPMYRKRITDFLIEPPSDDWDGIMRFSEK